MPFLKGPVSFVRYRAEFARPLTFGQTHLDALALRALGKLSPAAEVTPGWAAGESVLDGEFTAEKNVFPDHLAFDLWTLTDKLPADLLHAYYTAELKALAKDNPSGKPSARQKREAKQAARDRLEEEAKDGRFRKRKCVPVLWDGPESTVYLATPSPAAAARFEKLFADTFGPLKPVTAGSLAVSLFPQADDLFPAEFVKDVTPAEFSWTPGDGPPDWLGNEFLLWLWYYADAVGDTLQLPDGTEATFMFSGGVKVEDPRGQSGRMTANSDCAPRLPESRAAARAGKLPRKAALTLVRSSDQFGLVLAAETLAVSSGKLPAPPEDVTGRGALEHRLQAVRDLAGAVDGLFGAFLERRLSGDWAGELRDVQAWLKGLVARAA